MQVIRKAMQGEKRIEVRFFRRTRKETNWDLAGKARSKCVTDVGHKVQLPLGPSTSDASANWNLIYNGL